MPNRPLYTTQSLAQHLQVSTRTVQREVRRGRLSFVLVGGRRRYRPQDVDEYLRQRDVRTRFRVIPGGLSVAR